MFNSECFGKNKRSSIERARALASIALVAVSLLSPRFALAAGKEPICPKPGTEVYQQGIFVDNLTYQSPNSHEALAFKGGMGNNYFSKGVVEAGGSLNASCVGDSVRVLTLQGPAWVHMRAVTSRTNLLGRIFGHK